MSSKTLCLMMRIAVVAVAVCGLVLIGYLLPSLWQSIIEANPEFQNWYLPWLIFLWVVSLPCLYILVLIWKVAGAVKDDAVFTIKTAGWIKTSSILLLADVALFFTGNIFFWLLGWNHPGVLIGSLVVDIFGIAFAVLAAVLSRYLTKAAILQEESEGTI